MLIGAIWLWMFWPMMAGQTVVGFRDSAYFYYPYFKWIDQQWESGQIPLWNPYCDLGHPVVADGTSSVFYPGKLVFLFRFLSYPSRYGIYIAGHVLLAAAGSYYFARRLGTSSIGATLAAFSYSFGGSVLFQTTNVVYLVSAALLPIALAHVWMMFRRRQFGNAVSVGVVCALMILGGDPQMAYLVGLMAVGVLFGKTVQFRRCARRVSSFDNRSSKRGFLVFGCSQLVIAAAVTFALSAIQILPTYTWTRQSVRSAADSAESISDLAMKAFQKHDPGSATEAIYQFSQPPWSVLEMFWPNVYGKLYPLDQHWGSKLPGADRVWTPSLYVGLLTVLLGLSAMPLKKGNRRRIWLTKLSIFFATASFGWYGLVWLWNEIVGNFGWSGLPGIGEPVGGVYWMMVWLLPEFHLFRYPAKLFVVASLAVCVLAGFTLSDRKCLSAVQSWCSMIIWLTLAAILSWPLTASIDRQWLQSNPTWFGPFDFEGARIGLLFSFIHVFAVSVIFCLVMRWIRGSIVSSDSTGLKTPIAFLLLLVVADVLIANHWLVPQVDYHLFEKRTDEYKHLAEFQAARTDIEFHVVVEQVPPATFFETSSSQRLGEIVTWQRESLHPKHNLQIPVGVIGSFSSIEHPANTAFAISAGKLGKDPDSDGSARIRFLPRIVPVSEKQLAGIAAGEIAGLELLSGKQTTRRDHEYRLEKSSNRHFELSISDRKSGGVLFRSLPCPGWEVQVFNVLTGEKYNDHQIDGSDFFLAALQPAGETRVIFEYSPIEFWIGLWITSLAWPILMLGFVLNCWRNHHLRSGLT